MDSTQKPKTYTAVVNSVVNVAGDFYLAKLKLTQPGEMSFLAGQYVICKIGPPKINHTLSIASAPASPASPRPGGPTHRGEPNPDGSIELLQSVAPMGEGSKWLLGLKPGDPIEMLGPLGKFVLQKESSRPKVFVATGCGIAPIRAMVVDALREQMTLYWGLRYETDVFWKEEFEGLATEHPNFRFIMTLSQSTDAWTGARGRVTEHVIKETPDLKNSEFYLCGTRGMIVDMRELLTKSGVSAERIYTETFF